MSTLRREQPLTLAAIAGDMHHTGVQLRTCLEAPMPPTIVDMLQGRASSHIAGVPDRCQCRNTLAY